jgi:hypothetical protein
MPLLNYVSQSYEVDVESKCVRATVTGGSYQVGEQVITATMVTVLEALKDGLRNTICECQPHPNGQFNSKVCDMLRIRSAQRIAVIKDRIENKRCKASNLKK